jgi:hypothetical protein
MGRMLRMLPTGIYFLKMGDGKVERIGRMTQKRVGHPPAG